MSERIPETGEGVLTEITEATGVSYDPDTRDVEFTGIKNDTEHYISLVEYLVERGYLGRDDLPISAKGAQTRYLINSTPSHEDGDMIRPREAHDDVFVETNHDTASKQRYARRYVEEFVLDV